MTNDSDSGRIQSRIVLPPSLVLKPSMKTIQEIDDSLEVRTRIVPSGPFSISTPAVYQIQEDWSFTTPGIHASPGKRLVVRGGFISGCAWDANIGWINLGDLAQKFFVQTGAIEPAADGDHAYLQRPGRAAALLPRPRWHFTRAIVSSD